MTQTQPQFQRLLLRIGSIVLLAGSGITIGSTAFHPSTEDPNNHALVFTKYANSDSWIAVHIGQFAGVVMVFAGGFVTLFRLLTLSESNMGFFLAWIGLAVTIMTASAYTVLQAVDGITQKIAVESWVDSPTDEKDFTFEVAEGIRFIEYGANSIFRVLQGTVAMIFGVAILKSEVVNKSIGAAGIILGAVTIYAGLEVAYVGFGGLTTIIGISMIVYFIWAGTLGGLMWKKSTSKRIQKTS